MSFRSTGIKGRLALGAVLLAISAPAVAVDPSADARIKELERKLERSIQMIETLQNEVQALKNSKVQETPTVNPANVEQAAKIDTLEKQVAQLGKGLSTHSNMGAGLTVHGFADVGMRYSTEKNPVYGKGNKGFNLGSFDLYMTPHFGNNVRSLVELNFEIDDSGNINTDLERLQIGYAFNDSLTAWLGRFHTPYGYWNTAFHHGVQMQTSLLRPRFLDFEDKGGILPNHTVGALATGTFDAAGIRIGYDAYVGNAHHIDSAGTLNPQMAGSTKGYRAMGGFNAWFTPRNLSGLRVGVHGMRGTIEDDTTTYLTRLNMYGVYGIYIEDPWEILSEYYRFDDTNLTGGSGNHQSSAWFGQVGYSIGLFTPYGRLERTSLDQADNYFSLQANGRSYSRSVVGLRYDVDQKSAIKLELNNTVKKDLAGFGDDRYNEARVQYSIRF